MKRHRTIAAAVVAAGMGAMCGTRAGAGVCAREAWSATGNQAGAYFGFSVAAAGDVNGDGYGDVIVGAWLYDNGQEDEGRAHVYLGSPTGLADMPVWIAESDQNTAQLGWSVASAGDVNGDGFGDVIVGANRYDDGQPDEGRAYVYLGSPEGLSADPVWTAQGEQANAWFGVSVASAGDVNGDGYDDVIVGAWLYDDDHANEGRAFLYQGSEPGLSIAPSWTADGEQAGAQFGFSVAAAGDVNGDGYGDVIVGARSYDNGQINEGRAYVYFGSWLGLTDTPAWSAESDQTGALFGYSVAGAGDVNGDGFSDVIVGSWLYDGDQIDEGRAFVYLGSADGLSLTPAWTIESDQTGSTFSFSVAAAGDVNGDSYGDVIVGAAYYDHDQADEGRAFVYLGSESGLSPAPAWTVLSDQPESQFGLSVATAGDVNGDGFADVIVGAPTYDSSEPDEGGAFVYFGTPATSPCDLDGDCDVDLADFARFQECLNGPDVPPPPSCLSALGADLDGSGLDVDLADFRVMQIHWGVE